ncbi:hypothetical protein D0Z00_002694 [Geotrichum galactomycetum]|uniref:Uncharacterized protein n=1 Tax=Geotrichum galactomycetum TaxID=27317 RepID=A0ACB6V3D7_9ASCO|nr:hypothetical protein D0Z00_002694 [Geotrichum candidum]
MVETITKHQIPTEFSFPLRPNAENSNEPSTYTPSRTSNHSRQYTGIQIDLPTTNNDTLKPPAAKSAHRKHAHRRSAAISHDFSIDQLDIPGLKPSSFALAPSISLDNHLPRASSSTTGKAINSPYGNYSASTSSPQLPPAPFSKSTSSLPSSPEFKSRKVVQFAPDITEIEKTANSDDDTPIPPPTLAASPHFIESTISSAPTPDTLVKHKKVKSWAGNFIKFRSHKKDNGKPIPIEKQSALENDSFRKSVELSPSTLSSGSRSPKVFNSSSYVSTVDVSDSALMSLAISSSEPAEPLIDLDAALGPFRTPNSFKGSQFEISHRRTESAPESVFNQLGGRPRFDRSLMKRRGNSIVADNEDVIIEEEEDTSSTRQQQAASLSTTSLVSSSSVSSLLTTPITRKKKHFEAANSLKLAPILVNEPLKRESAARSPTKPNLSPKITTLPSTPKTDGNKDIPVISISGSSFSDSSTLNASIPKSKSSGNVNLGNYTGELTIPRSRSMILPDDDAELQKENMSAFGEPGPAVHVDQRVQPPMTPTTPRRNDRKASSGRHAKRFSISSLASLGLYSPSTSSMATTASTRHRVTRRVLSWVGIRTKPKM